MAGVIDFGCFWVGDVGSVGVTGFSPRNELLDDECSWWVSQWWLELAFPLSSFLMGSVAFGSLVTELCISVMLIMERG